MALSDAPHEAAHAVLAHSLGFTVREVTLDAEGGGFCRIGLSGEVTDPFVLGMLSILGSGGVAENPSEIHWSILEAMSPERLIAFVAQSMAGTLAARRYHPEAAESSADVAAQEEMLARLPDRNAAREEAHALATRLIEKHEDTILGIAGRLIHERTLSRERFVQLFDMFEQRRLCEGEQ